jgi:purine catabolism regulator
VHATLINAILAQAHADPDEVAVRARALGIPVTGRRLLTAVIRFATSGSGLSAQAQVLEVAEAMADACRAEHIPALVGSVDEGRAAALLSLDERADPDGVLAAVCAATRQRFRHRARHMAGAAEQDPVIGIGSPAASMGEVRRSLLEAQQVADAAAQAPSAADVQPFYRLADLRLRGLLHLLAGDARLATFVDRELGPLLGYDAARGTDLTGVLAAYLAAGGNKAEAAVAAQLARPTLYERLRHIERILGVSLDSAESRSSLHVALLSRRAAGSTG